MGQNIEWKKRQMEKTPNRTKGRMEKHRMGQNVEWKNVKWDKTPNGNMERKICVNIFGFLLLLRKPWGTICLKKVENG